MKIHKGAGHRELETEEGKGPERVDGRFDGCHVQLKDLWGSPEKNPEQ